MSEDILRLTLDLYSFVQDTEPLTTDRKLPLNTQRFRDLAEDLRGRFESTKEKAHSQLQDPIGAVRENLRAMLEELRKQQPSTGKLRSTWLALGKNYEALALRLEKSPTTLPKDVRLEHIKTRNYTRNLFHFCNSLWTILLYEWLRDKTQVILVASAFLVLAGFIEVVRRISPVWNRRFCDTIFGSVSRPHEEYSITSATWYIVALFIGVICMPQHAIEASTLMLGVGDPIAAIVGMKFGKHKLFGRKSVEGSLAFFLSSTLALGIFFSIVTELEFTTVALLSAGVSLAGTITELLTGRVEDNLSIPLVGGFVAMALLALV